MKEKNRKPKICVVTTVGLSLDKLFPDFYPILLCKGYEITGVCATDIFVDNVRKQGVRVIPVPMTRTFTPIQDLKCLWMVYKIFKQEQFDLIHYSTPKAALLAAIAGRLACCPALLYTLRGLGYTAFSGFKRIIGKFCEKIACHFAHRVISISQSLKDESVKEKLLQEYQVEVLVAGSSKGVNLGQFQLNDVNKSKARKIRQNLGISNDAVVVGYVGRLTKEKGIDELLEAFNDIRTTNEKVHLILVGDQDQRNPLPVKTIERIKEVASIHTVPFNDNVPPYIAAMDILVLPSYREGFGNTLIEASAMERPVIGTDIPGCRDAIIGGTTGLLVEPRDSASLKKAISNLINSPSERLEMGRNGRKWVAENFDRNLVWNKLIEVYEQMFHLKMDYM